MVLGRARSSFDLELLDLGGSMHLEIYARCSTLDLGTLPDLARSRRDARSRLAARSELSTLDLHFRVKLLSQPKSGSLALGLDVARCSDTCAGFDHDHDHDLDHDQRS